MEVKSEKFQGPLGLLLQLIEKQKLDITEIGLAAICDQYINYIKSDDNNVGAEEMADFLLIAAKLLYIKSRSLLPYLYPAEDDCEIDDLKMQLKMYKEFVEASKKIKELATGKKFLYIKNINNNQIKKYFLNIVSFFPPKELKKEYLKDTFVNFLDNLKPKIEEIREERVKRVVTIEERIDYIKNILNKHKSYSFNKLVNQKKDKTEIIINFLAVLELAKQKQLIFKQDFLFGNIDIFRF
jgi:segregation and condensation protein A